MKVLLFVQTGDARPTVRWTGASARRVAACYARDEARNAASSGPGDRVPPYWLVECANADAGRVLIADALYRPSDVLASEAWAWVRKLPSTGRPHGRILASGGRP